MKTKTMKTIQLWMLAIILTICSSTVLTSCSKDDPVIPPEPQPLILKGEAAVACEAYIAVFPQFDGRVEYIEEHYPEMPFYCIDNSHNNGGKRVTNEEAKLWDYSMTEDLQQKLYAIKQSYIDSGQLTPEQIEALQ